MPVVLENSSAKATDNNEITKPHSQSSFQSSRCISTISSFFSTFSINETLPTSSNSHPKKKSNSFTQSTFRGLGCAAAASQQVSVPSLIRTSADWEAKREKKKQEKNTKKRSEIVNEYVDGHGGFIGNESNNSLSCGVVQDVGCGPGIGFSPNAVGSVDCVVVARRNVSERKLDGEKFSHRERTCLHRRTVDETFPFVDSDPAFISCPDVVPSGTQCYRHARRPSPGGVAEIMMLQNSLLMRERAESRDRFTDWRLDIDHMTYEQLLDLGDRIGHVNTGLKEDEIISCLRRVKNSVRGDLPSLTIHIERKCSICQEEYELNDETGKLCCGHSFHFQCIKQWLAQKNACPVCKTAAVAPS